MQLHILLDGPGSRAAIRPELPPELIGSWTVADYPYVYELDRGGSYWVHDEPRAYDISEDGRELSFAGDLWQRVYGSGASIVGLWRCGAQQEELLFREDGTHARHDLGDAAENWLGRYAVSEGMLKLSELRALVTVEGHDIVFDPPYAPDLVGTYELIDGELHVSLRDGTTIVYVPARNSDAG